MTLSKVCCIGAGYVGGPTCTITANKCHDVTVTVTDLRQEQIYQWHSEIPIYEPGLNDIVCGRRGRNSFFSTDVQKAILEAELIFICVNTPTKNYGRGKGRTADLKYAESATRTIAEVVNQSKIVVEKSSVFVKAAESISQILKANHRTGVQYQILSNPELLTDGTAVNDLLQPDRVLIGGDETTEGREAVESLCWIYQHMKRTY